MAEDIIYKEPENVCARRGGGTSKAKTDKPTEHYKKEKKESLIKQNRGIKHHYFPQDDGLKSERE